MSDYPMLISNKLHSFRNFYTQMYMKKRERERSLCFFSLSLLEFLTLIAYLIPRLAFTLLVRLMLNVSLT